MARAARRALQGAAFHRYQDRALEAVTRGEMAEWSKARAC